MDKTVRTNGRPCQPLDASPAMAAASLTGGRRLKGGARVLAATTRQSVLRAISVFVMTAGMSLSVSPDGLHALMSAVQQPPELIILDDDIGGVGSEDVERMLARDQRTRNVPIVHVQSRFGRAPGALFDHDNS